MSENGLESVENMTKSSSIMQRECDAQPDENGKPSEPRQQERSNRKKEDRPALALSRSNWRSQSFRGKVLTRLNLATYGA